MSEKVCWEKEVSLCFKAINIFALDFNQLKLELSNFIVFLRDRRTLLDQLLSQLAEVVGFGLGCNVSLNDTFQASSFLTFDFGNTNLGS